MSCEVGLGHFYVVIFMYDDDFYEMTALSLALALVGPPAANANG
jgi:hypothetical protein